MHAAQNKNDYDIRRTTPGRRPIPAHRCTRGTGRARMRAQEWTNCYVKIRNRNFVPVVGHVARHAYPIAAGSGVE